MTTELTDVRFWYDGPHRREFSIDHLQVDPGEAVVLTGNSGSGKSTLLGLLCGVLPEQSGSITVAGHIISGQSGARRDRLRADHIGYIFQRSNLLPFLSPVENVTLAGQFSKRRRKSAGASNAARADHATHFLEQLGVGAVQRKTSTLSVGQQQRVAAARALYGGPSLLVADEPTAALDPENRDRFFELFLGEAQRVGAGVLVVSHDPEIIPLFDRHVEISEIAQWKDQV